MEERKKKAQQPTTLCVVRSRYKKYKALYKKSLEQGDQESQHGKLWELEETLDVTNILIARQQARLEVRLCL